MGDLLTILVEYGHTVSSNIDVSSVVDCHSVRPHGGKHLPVGQVAVGLNVIFQDPVSPCLRYKKMFPVGSSDNSVGLVKR